MLASSPFTRHGLAVVLAATLSACGGGGTGSGDVDSAPATPDPIDKYLGTIVSSCQTAGLTTSGDAPLQTQKTWSVPSKVSATKATYLLTLRTYQTSDCSGTAYSTIRLANDGTTYLQVDGTKTIGTQTVDKMTFGEGIYFHGFSAATITVDGVRYTGAPYDLQTPQTHRDITLFQGQSIYAGDFSKPLDAQGYPTALAAAMAATKQ